MMEILKNKTMIGFIMFVALVVGIYGNRKPVIIDSTNELVIEGHIVYENEYLAQNK